MTDFIKNRLMDVKAGLTTMPMKQDIVFSFLVFSIYGACAAVVGFSTGFLKITLYDGSIITILLTPIILLIIPSIPEELFFRAFLLPHKSRVLSFKRQLTVSALSIVLFVLWHPFTALTLYNSVTDIFTDPTFLMIVTLLAIACTVTYLKTGCVWIPVFIHWATVMVWLFFLEGRNFAIDNIF